MTANSRFHLDRRALLAGAAGLGALTFLPGLLAAQEVPKKGGTLKMGIGGGSTTDDFDLRKMNDWVPVNQAYMVMNGLVEIDKDNKAQPELFESWEAQPGAIEWSFKVRQGVSFHNGKALTADDIIYSLNLHRGPDTPSGARSIAAVIKDLAKVSDSEVKITLESGNADLPYMLSDYHFLVVPDGFTDWAKPIGTGPFIPESIEPGVRGRFTRNPNYWKPGCANVDVVEVIVINDLSARTNALMSGQVQAINAVDFKTVDLLKRNPRVQVIQSAGGQHFTFPMNCTQAPFSDNNIRLAIKYSVDREQLLNTALRGYGQLGNDHPIPKTDRFFNTELPQRVYDPEKAKFHLKQAGLDKLDVTLQASDAAFAGAVDAAAIYRTAAAAAGINVTIQREPADGYWENVWMKAPFCMSYWGGRPTADQMLTIAYQSTSAQNDSYWKNEKFDQLLTEARALLDDEKRKAIYWELQQMISDEGGVMIPMFGDYLDGVSVQVKGVTPHPMFNLMGARFAEKVWLEA
ncbi:ABC transporter substrate-binding protein [Paracoccus aminophilus]|uniref:ABC-type dipeptide transport system, periplasmic component n=1 Tax=Paracoccus aminophilus JCM 7686 TaxID=1367847 RepID=S5XUK3_PARAH|nr:ABC transporter substrate-binding protein [Paracoccus aminophilus]AGT11174.1 ABC-type dipeptide transport system, periplasmic component [Paracoccus aminophilus JCM 7686]